MQMTTHLIYDNSETRQSTRAGIVKILQHFISTDPFELIDDKCGPLETLR